jgi:hypothetical protein
MGECLFFSKIPPSNWEENRHGWDTEDGNCKKLLAFQVKFTQPRKYKGDSNRSVDVSFHYLYEFMPRDGTRSRTRIRVAFHCSSLEEMNDQKLARFVRIGTRMFLSKWPAHSRVSFHSKEQNRRTVSNIIFSSCLFVPDPEYPDLSVVFLTNRSWKPFLFTHPSPQEDSSFHCLLVKIRTQSFEFV